jgi:hypothetical protein
MYYLPLFQALIVGETTSTGVGECMPSATAALMCQVPPPHFCSTVVRLIALQILTIGVSRQQRVNTHGGDEKCIINFGQET